MRAVFLDIENLIAILIVNLLPINSIAPIKSNETGTAQAVYL